MKTLVIDTAFEQCQVGIWDADTCLASISETGGGQHDRVLVPLVEQALAEAKIALKNLDRIFVTTGPGRFTGLRVGIAFARGLALVHDTPLLGISTVDALEHDWTHHSSFSNSDAVSRVLLVSVKRGETYALRMTPERKALERVMDDDFLSHFAQDKALCVAGVVSPDLKEILAANPQITVMDDIQYPSLQAIFAIGNAKEITENAPVRPHYALD